MMESSLVGTKKTFGIEYLIIAESPPFGHVRIWANNSWFGDHHNSMFLYYMAMSLKDHRDRDSSVSRVVFESAEKVPTEDQLLWSMSYSWGEVFDDFLSIVYAVESERMIHVLWQLHPSRALKFPGYSLGRHHERVPYSTFDAVVTEFLRVLAVT